MNCSLLVQYFFGIWIKENYFYNEVFLKTNPVSKKTGYMKGITLCPKQNQNGRQRK